MATTKTSTALMPISVTCAGQTVDMSIPQSVPLAEAVPGLVDALGRMDPRAASSGFAVVTSSGRTLDQSKSLPEQGVSAGASLTLEPIGQSARDLRYDDLIEAVGSSVEKQTDAWSTTDSLQLSSHAAAALVLVAAVLLTVGGDHGHVSTAIGAIGALLVTGAALVVARIPAHAGAVSLLSTAPVLMMAAGVSLAGGGWKPLSWLLGGIGVLIACPFFLVLPSRLRTALGAPLVVGLSMVVAGAAGTLAPEVPQERIAAIEIAVLLIISLSAPWIALAQIPMRVTGPTSMAPVDIDEVDGRISASQVFVLALKSGLSIAMLFLAPMLVSSPEAIILLGATGIALMLTTRFLRSRIEVLIGAVTGMALTVSAAAGAAMIASSLVPVIVVATLAAAVALLTANVVNARLRPWLTRAADALGIIVLLAIIPLVTLVWGVL